MEIRVPRFEICWLSGVEELVGVLCGVCGIIRRSESWFHCVRFELFWVGWHLIPGNRMRVKNFRVIPE